MDSASITTLLDARRIGGVTSTPGGRVVISVQELNTAGTRRIANLQEYVDGVGDDAAGSHEEATALTPLTRGGASVGSVALAEDGTTFFTAKRTGEDGEESDDAQLWALPARGEARELASRPGGFGSLHLGDGVLIAELQVHSQAADETEHAELSAKREKAKVTAALHSGFPTRYWDADLGPARTVLALAQLPEDLLRAEATPAPGREGSSAEQNGQGTDEREESKEPAKQVLHFRHLEMPPGRLVSWVADRAGRRAVAVMQDSWEEHIAAPRTYLLDLTGQAAPSLLYEEGDDYRDLYPVEFSVDGRRVVCDHGQAWTAERSLRVDSVILDPDSGEWEPLWPEFDRWASPIWLDEETLVAATDDQGRGAVWIGRADDAAPRRLAGGPEQELSFSDLQVAGGQLVALASSIIDAPFPVRIDPGTGAISALHNPADELEQAGALTEVTAEAADGEPLRAWLRLPEGEGPHPLVVFAHGGPWGSWNAWTYRWNPNPFVAAGYAVLLPDPAISTGYGQHMIERGQHELGGAPYTDIMALTEETIARPDIDETRTAFAGGSYGGYMANWVAGHTGDRFRCIVTHASLWDTAAMGPTTDNSGWEPPLRPQNPHYNPKDHVREIQVPMLVIHGDKDYRVPIAQGHALWYDLLTFSATPKDAQGRTRHRYLYFPDEGHWITGRGNAEVWYQTFLAFLDEHVLGDDSWERPATLG